MSEYSFDQAPQPGISRFWVLTGLFVIGAALAINHQLLLISFENNKVTPHDLKYFIENIYARTQEEIFQELETLNRNVSDYESQVLESRFALIREEIKASRQKGGSETGHYVDLLEEESKLQEEIQRMINVASPYLGCRISSANSPGSPTPLISAKPPGFLGDGFTWSGSRGCISLHFLSSISSHRLVLQLENFQVHLLEHAEAAIDVPPRPSTISRFSVRGTHVSTHEEISLGEFEASPSKLNNFGLASLNEPVFLSSLTIDILDNHGQASHTYVSRIRLFSHIADINEQLHKII